MIHRSRVEKPPFERLRRLYAGAVGMPPEPPEMVPVPRHRADTERVEIWDFIPRHGAGIDHRDSVLSARLRANFCTPIARAVGGGPILTRDQRSSRPRVLR